MSIIYVTGLSGSGKSTFAKMLADKLNYNYVSGDEIAHKLYKNQIVLDKVKELFGNEVFDENGTFNRKKLGKIFFENKNSPLVKDYEDFTWNVAKSEIESLLTCNVVFDWILTPTTSLWEKDSIKVLVKAKSDDERLNEIAKRDNLSIDYIKSRDKAAPVYNESEFDVIIENDYNMQSLEDAAVNLSKKINSCLKVKVLGESSPYALSGHACPSYLVTCGDSQVLLDCGSGSHANYNFDNLNGLNIVISHLHKDHFNDVFNYQYAALVKHNHGKMNESVKIYLPDYQSDIAKIIIDEESEYCSCYGINEKSAFKAGCLSVSFMRVEHSKSVTSYAVKIFNRNKKIVYTGDISYSNFDKISEFAKDADLLICESSLLTEHGFDEICSHLTASQAGEIARKANVKKLLLTHFWPEEDKNKYLAEAKSKFDNVVIAQVNKEIYVVEKL